MSLNYQDVQQILTLLDDSPYDELTLTLGSMNLSLQRSADGNSWQHELNAISTPKLLAQDGAAPPQAATAAPAAVKSEAAASEAGLVDVRAPMVGTWYHAPKPGAEPFISIGSEVATDSLIGIIEVMKLMSSIPAGVTGTVVEILTADASFVEAGQLLIRVRPAAL